MKEEFYESILRQYFSGEDGEFKLYFAAGCAGVLALCLAAILCVCCG